MKSTHIRHFPLLFLTRTTLASHSGYWISLMWPAARSFCVSSLIACLLSSLNCLLLLRMGLTWDPSLRDDTRNRGRSPACDGGGPSTPHHGSQDPRQNCDERLDSRRERLGHDEGRLQMERLGGGLDRLGPITRSMAKHIHAQMEEATDGREKALYMLHGGPLGVA